MERKGVLRMVGRIIASADGWVSQYSPADGWLEESVDIPGAGAMCVSRSAVFCAGEGGLIWRLHPRTLSPQALFSGGPGVQVMCLSGDERRLYALCAEGDSVLMCSAEDGRALLLNRAGVNPQGMTLSDDGKTLLVAGGESAQVLLFCPHTLRLLRALSAPGIVCAAAAFGGVVYALCMDDTLSSVLVTFPPGGQRRSLRLEGLPGGLFLRRGGLVAAVEQRLYTVSSCGRRVLAVRRVPGRAGRLLACGMAEFLLDAMGERLYEHWGGGWRCIRCGVKDTVCVGGAHKQPAAGAGCGEGT